MLNFILLFFVPLLRIWFCISLFHWWCCKLFEISFRTKRLLILRKKKEEQYSDSRCLVAFCRSIRSLFRKPPLYNTIQYSSAYMVFRKFYIFSLLTTAGSHRGGLLFSPAPSLDGLFALLLWLLGPFYRSPAPTSEALNSCCWFTPKKRPKIIFLS